MQFLLTWFLFVLVPDAGSGFLMHWRDTGAEFPALTRVAIGLLRVAAPDPHTRPVTTWWAWLVWIAVLAVPLVTIMATVRAGTPEAVSHRFSIGSWLWLTVLLGVVSAIAMGCALSFACL